MAVGAVIVTKQGVFGNVKYAIVNVVGATSYTTTGDALDLNAITGFSSIYATFPTYGGAAGGLTTPPTVNAAIWRYDPTAKKLQAFGTAGAAAGLTESTAATNFSTSTITLFVLGS